MQVNKKRKAGAPSQSVVYFQLCQHAPMLEGTYLLRLKLCQHTLLEGGLVNILYCPTISLSYSLTVTLSTVPSYSILSYI